MAAVRHNAMRLQRTRDAIRVTRLVKRLQSHVFAGTPLSRSQIASIKLLLDKSLPNLESVTIDAHVGVQYVNPAPPRPSSFDEWIERKNILIDVTGPSLAIDNHSQLGPSLAIENHSQLGGPCENENHSQVGRGASTATDNHSQAPTPTATDSHSQEIDPALGGYWTRTTYSQNFWGLTPQSRNRLKRLANQRRNP